MKRYSTYKQSGVEWLGEVPLDWEVWKVSRLYKKIGSGTTPKAGNPEFYENGTIPWVNTGDLNDGYISYCSNYITQKAFDEHSALKINDAGTLLVAMYGATIGKIAITEFAACTNQACCSLAESKLIDSKFAFYWFIANKENVVNLSYGGGQPNISQDIIRGLKIPICKIEEQHSIVRFLDYKTAQIDSFIANRQKQIELLKEQKAGIINKAVSKGINPNAKMKASGIEWLPEVPENWEVWKVSRLFKKIGSGTTPKSGTPEYYENGTIPWVNTGDLNDGVLNECGTRITEKAFANHSTLKIYNKGTLLIAMYGATIAKLSILNFEACTNQACCALADSNLIEIDFAFYWFLSQKQNIINLSYGGGQPNISQDVIRSIRIPIPKKSEQQNIIEFIRREILTIDTLISKYQKQIDLMQEYRTSLISQAVTGKIDVRDWKPKIKEYSIEKPENMLVAEE